MRYYLGTNRYVREPNTIVSNDIKQYHLFSTISTVLAWYSFNMLIWQRRLDWCVNGIVNHIYLSVNSIGLTVLPLQRRTIIRKKQQHPISWLEGSISSFAIIPCFHPCLSTFQVGSATFQAVCVLCWNQVSFKIFNGPLIEWPNTSSNEVNANDSCTASLAANNRKWMPSSQCNRLSSLFS